MGGLRPHRLPGFGVHGSYTSPSRVRTHEQRVVLDSDWFCKGSTLLVRSDRSSPANRSVGHPESVNPPLPVREIDGATSNDRWSSDSGVDIVQPLLVAESVFESHEPALFDATLSADENLAAVDGWGAVRVGSERDTPVLLACWGIEGVQSVTVSCWRRDGIGEHVYTSVGERRHFRLVGDNRRADGSSLLNLGRPDHRWIGGPVVDSTGPAGVSPFDRPFTVDLSEFPIILGKTAGESDTGGSKQGEKLAASGGGHIYQERFHHQTKKPTKSIYLNTKRIRGDRIRSWCRHRFRTSSSAMNRASAFISTSCVRLANRPD
ncbi:hypothetical protein SVXHr_1735 [Halorhabdus sp. SVX81]|nr:hypothetical protein SVXHr_1735 [Halorhabdus sp. SVX81]